jgi:hypothetical protein
MAFSPFNYWSRNWMYKQDGSPMTLKHSKPVQNFNDRTIQTGHSIARSFDYQNWKSLDFQFSRFWMSGIQIPTVQWPFENGNPNTGLVCFFWTFTVFRCPFYITQYKCQTNVPIIQIHSIIEIKKTQWLWVRWWKNCVGKNCFKYNCSTKIYFWIWVHKPLKWFGANYTQNS